MAQQGPGQPFFLPLVADAVPFEGGVRFPTGILTGTAAIEWAIVNSVLSPETLELMARSCPVERDMCRLASEAPWSMDRVWASRTAPRIGRSDDELLHDDPQDAQYGCPDALIWLGDREWMFRHYLALALKAADIRNILITNVVAAAANRTMTRKDVLEWVGKSLGFFGFPLSRLVIHPGTTRDGGEIPNAGRHRYDLDMIVPLVGEENSPNPEYAYIWRPGLDFTWNPHNPWSDANRVFAFPLAAAQLYAGMKAMSLNMPEPFGGEFLERAYRDEEDLSRDDQLQYVWILRQYAYPRFLRYLATLEHKLKNGQDWGFPSQPFIWAGVESMMAGVKQAKIKWDITSMLLRVADHYRANVWVPRELERWEFGRQQATKDLDGGMYSELPSEVDQVRPGNFVSPDTEELFDRWNPTRQGEEEAYLMTADLADGARAWVEASNGRLTVADVGRMLEKGAGGGWAIDREGNYNPGPWASVLYAMASASSTLGALMKLVRASIVGADYRKHRDIDLYVSGDLALRGLDHTIPVELEDQMTGEQREANLRRLHSWAFEAFHGFHPDQAVVVAQALGLDPAYVQQLAA